MFELKVGAKQTNINKNICCKSKIQQEPNKINKAEENQVN